MKNKCSEAANKLRNFTNLATDIVFGPDIPDLFNDVTLMDIVLPGSYNYELQAGPCGEA